MQFEDTKNILSCEFDRYKKSVEFPKFLPKYLLVPEN